MAARSVHGMIQLEAPLVNFNGVVRIQLLDTSRADAPSRVVAEEIIRTPSDRLLGGTQMSFAIPVTAQTHEDARYELRAHVDEGASGQVKTGDQITMQSYPVSLANLDRLQELQLKRIR